MIIASGTDGIDHDVLVRVFQGDNQLVRLCHQREWTDTSLGPAREWPQSLRTAAGLVTSSSFPMLLAWGPDLVQIYNDAYLPILGTKHPAALGQPVSESWTEIWAEVEPLFARVLSGETVAMVDLPLTIHRGGGAEEVFFTFSYSPVYDEQGGIGGVLVAVFETTEHVQKRHLSVERERLYDELTLEKSRLAFIFQRAPAFLAVLRGPEHTFDLVNDAYYQLVGHRELIARPVLDALPEIRDQGFGELLDGVLKTGEPFLGREVPVLLARTPGAPPEERFVDLSYIPLLEADDTRSGVIAHGTDVTEQVLARREVERLLAVSEGARGEAEAANRSKMDFLSAMSHELRTPLNAIGGYTELLEMGIHGPVTEAQRLALGRIATGQRHLLVLINDILSHARLEAGHLEFDLRPLAIPSLLASIEPLVALQAEAKGITLSVHVCEPPLRMIADEERVRQILLNLTGNAIKFTDRGGSVTLSCEADGEWASFRVRDNGRGIPPDQHSRIFDAFQQVGRRLDDPQEGVGLGLAISRDLAVGMGGDLSVESAPGEGSTFTLRLLRSSLDDG